MRSRNIANTGGRFYPMRFLNLLPLSHLFGQTLATFIPPMMAGTVVFQRSYHPEEIVRQIHSRRISVLVSVPKILEVLRDYILHEFPESSEPAGEACTGPVRWWRFRRVHRALRLEILGVHHRRRAARSGSRGILSAARLPGDSGLRPDRNRAHRHAEPSISHAPGTVGTPVGGVEIELAEDGEVLVRGGNVSTRILRDRAPARRRKSLEDGWLQPATSARWTPKAASRFAAARRR